MGCRVVMQQVLWEAGEEGEEDEFDGNCGTQDTEQDYQPAGSGSFWL